MITGVEGRKSLICHDIEPETGRVLEKIRLQGGKIFTVFNDEKTGGLLELLPCYDGTTMVLAKKGSGMGLTSQRWDLAVAVSVLAADLLPSGVECDQERNALSCNAGSVIRLIICSTG